MKIQAQVVADSKNEFGDRIVTMVLTYPRIIHAEFMTHRMFSRNAASSRAVPAAKMIDAVENNPFIPIAWQRSHKGMQGTEYITDQKEIDLEVLDWLDDRDYAVKKARGRLARGVTKQLVNRPLETFQWYTTIVTATEWENFFALRCPRYRPIASVFRSRKDLINYYRNLKGRLLDGSIVTAEHAASYWEKNATELEWLQINKGQAEIHMMALAEAMWDAYQESKPKELIEGEWHIPYYDQIIDQYFPDIADSFFVNGLALPMSIKLSTVMCARTSYTVVGEDLKPLTYQRMIEIHDEMAGADPKHMSPFEHCAPAMTKNEFMTYTRTRPGHADPVEEDKGREVEIMSVNGEYVMERGWLGNFRGFKQYRKMIKGENII